MRRQAEAFDFEKSAGDQDAQEIGEFLFRLAGRHDPVLFQITQELARCSLSVAARDQVCGPGLNGAGDGKGIAGLKRELLRRQFPILQAMNHAQREAARGEWSDRKGTTLKSRHTVISYS